MDSMVEFEFPDSIDDILNFTNRKLPDGTKIVAYVPRQICPECKKADMGKPINEKTGRPKIRSKTYECPECGYEEPKQSHEDSCEVIVQYTNPEGTELKKTTASYERKTWRGMKSIIFHNEFLDERFGITKRMKTKKDKKKKSKK
jgi:predicted RNA-binding Zn-ribbon protein involved in translation (DUF1610 family)